MPATRAKQSAAKATRKLKRAAPATRAVASVPTFVTLQLTKSAISPRFRNRKPVDLAELKRRLKSIGGKATCNADALLASVNRINPAAAVPVETLPADVRASLGALKGKGHRFHGAKVSLAWFPIPLVFSRCSDKFGYLSSAAVRTATRLPFNATMRGLMDQLGALMGDQGRDNLIPDSIIPAGFTYVGQFIDHDVTFDVSSSLDVATDANTISNMRTPALDLDSLYGRGPALDPFLYVFPSSDPATAIKFQLGTNKNVGPGGPAGSSGSPADMQVQTDFDVPRMHNPLNPPASSNTAIIGDPRNDENLIVAQFHQTMLRFHNQVVDLLVAAAFNGDIFVEARRIVTHHYQWAVVHDFLGRVCGAAVVNTALLIVNPAIGSPFRMPVEFAVAAYRFGHSMIRDNYWVNFNFPNATLGQVFEFNRNPRLPVFSNWVVDFNAFFDTGVPVPVNNKARKIDSILAFGLESLPGLNGMMAVLAMRNLRRGLALGLPSGQGMALALGVPKMTPAQLTQGLPANEVAVLQSKNGLLLKKTPLWYYVLREAAVLSNGDRLGPVGARIVARTFVRMLRRDATSYLNVSGGFTPMLPSAVPGTFTFADLVTFAGVTQP